MDNTEEIQKYIKGSPVFVFGFSHCPYCHKAKELFKKLNVKYGYLDIDTLEKSQQLPFETVLEKMNNQDTYPQVFVNATFIGGFDSNYYRLYNYY